MITHEVSAEELLPLFRSAWWAAGRDLDGVAKMLERSDIVFGLRVDGRLAGFARVLTDDVYLALVLDVVVVPEFRGTGLGAALMDAIVGHPRIAGVGSVELVCQPELRPFYRRWGFTDEVGRSGLMRRVPLTPQA
ncbi:MAG TPA: GNAT family N-acetyltransferase [Candidatus Limnocylindrales bacterium]